MLTAFSLMFSTTKTHALSPSSYHFSAAASRFAILQVQTLFLGWNILHHSKFVYFTVRLNILSFDSPLVLLFKVKNTMTTWLDSSQ